jgi:hypothetical protein
LAVELILRADPRCQRGLRFTVALPTAGPDPDPDSDVAQDRLRAGLIAAFPEAVVGEERWLARRIDRLIVQFRVELRLGERPGQLVVLFRRCCPESERERLRERLLDALATETAACGGT